MDGAGNLYGTTYSDGAYGYGNVFELTPHNGSWFYTDLHDFTGGSDGGNPNSNVVFDTSGNLTAPPPLAAHRASVSSGRSRRS